MRAMQSQAQPAVQQPFMPDANSFNPFNDGGGGGGLIDRVGGMLGLWG